MSGGFRPHNSARDWLYAALITLVIVICAFTTQLTELG